MTSNCSHQLRSSICRQLFRERLSGKECTRQPREVTWISGDIIIFIYNHYAFSLQWRFFPKILRSSNRDLKPTYNAFQGCRVPLRSYTTHNSSVHARNSLRRPIHIINSVDKKISCDTLTDAHTPQILSSSSSSSWSTLLLS